MAPAHPHATGVAVYPALLIFMDTSRDLGNYSYHRPGLRFYRIEAKNERERERERESGNWIDMKSTKNEMRSLWIHDFDMEKEVNLYRESAWKNEEW